MVAGVSVASRRDMSAPTLARAAGGVVLLMFLLSPTLYPWYVAWIVPFLCFYGNSIYRKFHCHCFSPFQP